MTFGELKDKILRGIDTAGDFAGQANESLYQPLGRTFKGLAKFVTPSSMDEGIDRFFAPGLADTKPHTNAGRIAEDSKILKYTGEGINLAVQAAPFMRIGALTKGTALASGFGKVASMGLGLGVEGAGISGVQALGQGKSGREAAKAAAGGAIQNIAMGGVGLIPKFKGVGALPRIVTGATVGAVTSPLVGTDPVTGALFGTLGGLGGPERGAPALQTVRNAEDIAKYRVGIVNAAHTFQKEAEDLSFITDPKGRVLQNNALREVSVGEQSGMRYLKNNKVPKSIIFSPTSHDGDLVHLKVDGKGKIVSWDADRPEFAKYFLENPAAKLFEPKPGFIRIGAGDLGKKQPVHALEFDPAKGDYAFVQSEGHPYTLEGEQFVIRKSPVHGWTLTDPKTGTALGLGDTKGEAIEKAMKNIEEMKAKGGTLDGLRQKVTEKYGLPPSIVAEAKLKVAPAPKVELPFAPKKDLPEILVSAAKNKPKAPSFQAEPKMAPGGKAWTDEAVYKDIFKKLIGDQDVARTTGTQRAAPFAKIESKHGVDIIKELETPGFSKNPAVVEAAASLRKEYDALFKEATDAGVDMNYLDNYVTHIWKQSPEEVRQMYASLRPKFKFANERVVPTYEEGIKMGLTPKFSHPAQIVEEYATQLEKAKANVQALKSLQNEGIVVDGDFGARTPGYAPIQAPGFPKSRMLNQDGEKVISDYYAPKEVADQINNYFSPGGNTRPERAARFTAGLSSSIQDITLSGGVPKTPLNAFTVAQITKEVLSGRVASPMKAFFKSLDNESTQQFFTENAEQIKKMQSHNIPVGTSFEVANMIDQGWLKNTFGDSGAQAWNKVVNEPTFKRFMPMLHVNMFNDVEQAVLKAGKPAAQAEEVAAQAVKNFYGVTGTDVQAARSKFGENLKSTVFFAPKYRESMINFWVNNLKALKNPLAPENRANALFLVGAISTYAAMDAMNEAATGKHMYQNPQGKEDKLLIPLGDGTVIGIPFLSSIATVPRTAYKIGKNLIAGDPKQAAIESKALLSSLVRPPLDIATNENYFGSKIYKEDDSTGEKLADQGKYLLGAYNHPYIKAGIQLADGETPGYQVASQAAELPLRFYDEASLRTSDIYDKKDQAEAATKDRNNAYRAAVQSGDTNAIASAAKGMTSTQRSAIDRSIRENELKTQLTPEETAIMSMSKTERQQLAANLPEYDEIVNRVNDLEAGISRKKKNFTEERPKFMKVKKGRKGRIKKLTVSGIGRTRRKASSIFKAPKTPNLVAASSGAKKYRIGALPTAKF